MRLISIPQHKKKKHNCHYVAWRLGGLRLQVGIARSNMYYNIRVEQGFLRCLVPIWISLIDGWSLALRFLCHPLGPCGKFASQLCFRHWHCVLPFSFLRALLDGKCDSQLCFRHWRCVLPFSFLHALPKFDTSVCEGRFRILAASRNWLLAGRNPTALTEDKKRTRQ